MSRTYHHLSNARLTVTERESRATRRHRIVTATGGKCHESQLTCEHRGCDRPGLLILFPGLSELEAPAFCTEHLANIA